MRDRQCRERVEKRERKRIIPLPCRTKVYSANKAAPSGACNARASKAAPSSEPRRYHWQPGGTSSRNNVLGNFGALTQARSHTVAHLWHIHSRYIHRRFISTYPCWKITARQYKPYCMIHEIQGDSKRKWRDELKGTEGGKMDAVCPIIVTLRTNINDQRKIIRIRIYFLVKFIFE